MRQQQSESRRARISSQGTKSGRQVSRRFIVGVVALFLVFVLIEWRMPQHFVWKPTFAHNDDQPFGCMLLDSVLSTSLENGYEVSRLTPWQMLRDSAFSTPHGIIILSTEAGDSADARQLLRLARRGHTVLVANNRNLLGLDDTLHLTMSWMPTFDLSKWNSPPDTLTMVTDSMCLLVAHGLIDRRAFQDTMKVESILASIDFRRDSISIGTSGDVALTYKIGRGELIVVTAPLLLTNYAVLSEDLQPFISRIIGRMSHLPVVRTEAFMASTARQEQSPFYVFLQRPPLRLALYLTMLTVLLLLVFTARRRARAIPLIVPPVNGNLDFVRHVGTLYYEQGDHRGLVERKLHYAAEELRRLTGIDILEEHLPSDRLAQLSRLTGIDAEVLRRRIANAREATTGRHVVTPEEMKSHVDNLNEIIDNVNR